VSKLDNLITKLNKKFGENTLVRGADATWLNIEKIPTGSFALDLELRGGIPKSRITEIKGPLGSGKSSLCLLIARRVQKIQEAGGNVAWIDAEGVYDSAYAKKIGIDAKRIVISKPDFGEKAVDIVDSLVRSGEFELVVLDSVAAVSPMVEIEDSAQKQQMGIHARLMNKAVRKLQSALNTKISGKQNMTAVILINQIRAKIGILYGNPLTSPGGMGIGFAASLRLHLKRGDWLMIGKGAKERAIGQEIKFKVEKSKVSPVNVSSMFKYYIQDVPELGVRAGTVDYVDELFRYGVLFGLIKQSGGWYVINDKKFHGEEEVYNYLKKDIKVRKKLKRLLLDVAMKGYKMEK